MPQNDTPFEQQLHEDVAARRTAPTAQTIRIGSDGPPDADAMTSPPARGLPASGPGVPSPKPAANESIVARERTPLPVIIAVAMAVGAVCVMGGSLLIRRLVPDSKPSFTATNNSSAIEGTEVMNPELVIQNPEVENQTADSNESSAEIISEATTTPSVSVKESPETSTVRKTEVPKTAPPAGPPGETYVASHYEVTPPSGFVLSQSGRRTIWKHDNGAQILVETGKAGDGSARSGWVRLERDLKKRYGSRYKSLGIRDGELAGQPAAIWEFELTGKDGITRRKIDIGIQHKGRGFAVLGSAPKERFDEVLPQIRATLESFKLKSSGTSTEPNASKEIAKPITSPQESEAITTSPDTDRGEQDKPDNRPTKRSPKAQPENSVQPLPEPKPTVERGY